MNKTHTLIISDIHLGSEICNSVILLAFLRECFYERLIIAGDLTEKGGAFTREHFEFLTYLFENREKIIYVDGNHDPAEEGMVYRILGIPALKKYEWEMRGRKFCAMHGHQFDTLCFIFNEPLIDKIFSKVLGFLRTINFHWCNVAKWLDDFHNKLSYRIAKKAKKYAIKKGIDVMICGHIHKPGHFTFFDKKKMKTIEYVNCGSCTTDNACNAYSFVSMDENGKMKVHVVVSSQTLVSK